MTHSDKEKIAYEYAKANDYPHDIEQYRTDHSIMVAEVNLEVKHGKNTL